VNLKKIDKGSQNDHARDKHKRLSEKYREMWGGGALPGKKCKSRDLRYKGESVFKDPDVGGGRGKSNIRG